MIYYTIYKITNIINNKIYIGYHQTTNLDDGYMGSGNAIRSAIEKYKYHNFKKEILFIFDNYEDMKNKEVEIVNEEFISRPDTYNISVGGHGNFHFINSRGLQVTAGKKGGRRAAEVKAEKRQNDPEWARRESNNFSERNKGKPRSEETKLKISRTKRLKSDSYIHSSLGTVWINDGIKSKKINKGDPIPHGYILGRTKSKSL